MAKATSWIQVSHEARVLRYKTDSYELFAIWLGRLGYPVPLEQDKAKVNRIRQDGKDKPESGASYFMVMTEQCESTLTTK